MPMHQLLVRRAERNPDADLGARPCAFVTVEPGAARDEAGPKRAIAGTVPYDVAPLIVRIVDSLPMTPTGKIAKAELAASLAEAA